VRAPVIPGRFRVLEDEPLCIGKFMGGSHGDSHAMTVLRDRPVLIRKIPCVTVFLQ